MGKFDICHAITAKWEGVGLTIPMTQAEKTNWGITQATLSDWLGRPATAHEIRNLSKRTAEAIYKDRYWKAVAGDELPAGVDSCVYDFGVNSGPKRSVRSLQAALGVEADGWFGEETRAALARADIKVLINKLCDRRLAFLRALPKFNTFGKGWTARVEDIRKNALRMHAGAKPIEAVANRTPKATPPAPKAKAVSTEQLAGGVTGATSLVTVAGAFWRDNKDVLTDPIFLGAIVIVIGVAAFLLFRRSKPLEAL